MTPQASKLTQEGPSALPLPKTPENQKNAPMDSADALPGNSSLSFPHVVAEWQKNGKEVIRVSLSNFQRRNVIDIRTWFPGSEGEMRPGPKGITTEIKHLPALADGIAEALDAARRHGLVQEGGAE